jgi:hypothetical protein
MYMKRFFLIISGIALSVALFGQARKPSLMVVPSDNWCIQNGFFTEYNNQGTKEKRPNYRMALQENSELILVISKINELMANRGFPLENMETAIKSIEYENAERALLTSESGAEVAESPIDILKQTVQADIWLQITWTLNVTGPRKSVTFILQGLDAYSNKEIASASGTGAPSVSSALPVLLEEAVISRIDGFNDNLQTHFNDLFSNGREIALEIGMWDNFKGNLNSVYKGKEVNEIIEDWVYDNTKAHRFSVTGSTRNRMLFRQVRIEMYDERGRAQDARLWARGLQRYLQSQYQIEATLLTRGLGQATLMLGER